MEYSAIAGDGRPRFLAVLLLILFLTRWWLATLPGYPPDLNAYKRWATIGGNRGIATLYDAGSDFDYPPLYGYLLAPAGKLYALLDPEAASRFTDSKLICILVKVPPLAFDILLALLLAHLVRRRGFWGDRPSWAGWLPALLYLMNPAVLFLSGYWGQPDAVETFFVLAALLLILGRQPEWGWASAALGCLMKPLAAPFLPLLFVATLLRSGWKRLITGGLVGLVTFGAGFLPFVLTGRGPMVLQRLVGDVDKMPYTSVNGHNLWWLIGSWRPAAERWIGPLTPKAIGLGLFAAAYLLILWWVWRGERTRRRSRRDPDRAQDEITRDPGVWGHWFAAGAAVAISFFTLSTHMHENHLFPVLPFLIVLAGRGRPWVWLMAIASLSCLINMVTHDLILGDSVLRHIGGTSSYVHPDIDRPLSYLELCLAYGNAAITVLCCAAILRWTQRTCLRRPS
jgi:hypothetical protein